MMNTYHQTLLSAAPRAAAWLGTTRSAQILHIFDQVINLVNQDARVVSIVTPQIGSGPFSLMVAQGGFHGLVDVMSPVAVEQGLLTIGRLSFDCREYSLWDPQPAWHPLSQQQTRSLVLLAEKLLSGLEETNHFPNLFDPPHEKNWLMSPFSQALDLALDQIKIGFAQAEVQTILGGVASLAGLGVGLTPSGDDFLIGMMHGLWARAGLAAETLCQAIAHTAIPRTGTLSAAWLAAASQGEASQVWHTFFEALQAGDNESIQKALRRILQTGETSGADALSGFCFSLRQEKIL